MERTQSLFNGKDLSGWEPIGNVSNNKWIARDGELVNDNPEVEGQRGSRAANLKTTTKFQDFKLHIEVNCPENGNSGSISAAATKFRWERRADRNPTTRWVLSTATIRRPPALSWDLAGGCHSISRWLAGALQSCVTERCITTMWRFPALPVEHWTAMKVNPVHSFFREITTA